MKSLLPLALALAVPFVLLRGAEVPTSRITYQQAYGESKNPTALDPAKDLPRYPAVAPKDAVATWQVKPGFKLQLAAAEPLVRDPIAICFDERGRMFVCEMIDYSEERDHDPHWGRVSVLEDTDGDGVYDKSTVFADNLPWPTGLIWANGGLYVGATPDIWRFEDRDGDGKAEVREKVFTGFGTGLARLNVQALLNSFVWGQDNRVHVQSGTGNRGKISSPKRPDLPAQELAARDFWFDPRTHEFGFEAGGAQYGMSFDDWGRKFGCSNSDHLQLWVYDDRYATRNPFFTMPPARQSIAADGGAAEVFRISPDEPWRIVRTRWRISGVVKGVVEGGGRVSGYFTGATGTVVFRGDAYGADFVNNTFTGDAGGQLVEARLQLRHLAARVLLEALLVGAEDLVLLDGAEEVHAHRPGLVAGGDVLVRARGRLEVQAADIDLDDELLADAGAVELEGLALGGDGVGDVDAGHVAGPGGRGGGGGDEQGGQGEGVLHGRSPGFVQGWGPLGVRVRKRSARCSGVSRM